jgi:hypothetical protein
MSVKLAVQTVFSALDHMTGPMAKMDKGVARFARTANRAGAGVGAGFGRLRGIIGTVAAAVGAGAVAKVISDFASKGDDISDVSKRIGLSAEALQEFQYAAKAADITSDDLTSILQKMNNNMGQLGQGTGTLFAFLKKSNPQLALQLKHTENSETAFQTLMDTIAKETNVQKRAALAQAAFGKSGQAIIDMAGDLNAKRREAREIGAIIPEDEVKAAAELHGSLLRLRASGSSLMNRVLGRLVTYIGPVVDKINKWITANQKIIGQKVDRAFSMIGDAFRFIGPFLKVALDLFLGLKPVLPFVIAGIAALTVAQWALNVAMDANPVGAIILALTALVAIVIVVIRYWKEITAALTTGWNKVNEVFNNPGIRIALQMIAAPLAIILSIIQTIIDLVNGKGAKAFLNLLGPMKGVSDLLGITKGGGQIPVSPNTGVISSNATTTRNVNVDVGFNNPPPGTSIRQRGSAPEVTVGMFNTLRAQ